MKPDVPDSPGRPLTRPLLEQGARALCAGDTALRAVVERCGMPPLWARPKGFATLLHIILEQQVSLASARAALERLRVGLGGLQADRVSAASTERLQGLGLTRQKAGYCRDLAQSVIDGSVDLEALDVAEDAEARRVLLEIRGIGPWTADIYLLMALRRPDVWPDGDLALTTALTEVKGLAGRPAVKEARKIARAWTPWRSVAARILWQHYLMPQR